MTNVINLSGVSKAYKGVSLYENATATFPAGQITALAGPNGSGKSVLLRMICGFVRPDAGTVTIDESYMSQGRDFPEKFGIIIDRPAFLPQLNGFENLQELAAIRGVITSEKIHQTMRQLGLDPENTTRVARYSLGMKQKLAIAQAVMEDQEVLVLDEPFNALDRAAVENVRALLVEHRRSGGTVIFTSHNSEDIRLLAEEIYHVEGGGLTRESGTAALLS